MDELKKMGEGGQATGEGPTLFYFFFSLSERALPCISFFSVTVSFWALVKS